MEVVDETVTSSSMLLAESYKEVNEPVVVVRTGSRNVAVAGFWYVPGDVPAFTFTVNVIVTEPPPGIRNVPMLAYQWVQSDR